MIRQTTTETEYTEGGKVKRVTVTEYTDGGPVGPVNLPTWHPWFERGPGLGPVIVGDNPNCVPAVTCGAVKNGANNTRVMIDPETVAQAMTQINSTDRATRVTGE